MSVDLSHKQNCNYFKKYMKNKKIKINKQNMQYIKNVYEKKNLQ